ncbi:NAD(P)H-binding protein [Actinopolymorpha sp. B11F2]|uniref:NAD(P)H-binding protein n=1 Tax=Actinopolymorpha sp. B11F2 TaxID=3160862 RepID=UPI0032E3F9FD
MRVVIAGAHGKVGLRLGRMLADRGDDLIGIVRNPEHGPDLRAHGVAPIVLDLEQATVEAVSDVLAGADAAVFAAGAGPGSGAARKDTVDRAAAVLVAEAAEQAGVRRILQVSSMGVEQVRDGASPPGMDEVFVAYLKAKLAAEEDLRTRDLDWTILRPGGLTDAPGTGRVCLAPHVERGQVPREDVAAVLVALLEAPATAGLVLELTSGDTPIPDAVSAVTSLP